MDSTIDQLVTGFEQGKLSRRQLMQGLTVLAATAAQADAAATVIANPERSKVIGKIGFARWPKGPAGRRVTSIWNWAMPVNAALPEIEKCCAALDAAVGGATYVGSEFHPSANRYRLKYVKDGKVMWVDADGRTGDIIAMAR